MALTTDRERKICAKYRAIGKDGKIHCQDCPLNSTHYKNMPKMGCKRIMSFDRKTMEWIRD